MRQRSAILLVVLLLIGSLGIRAEENDRFYDIVVDSLCYVQAPDKYLDEFWRACREFPAEGQNVHVVHLGDSHVQGGYFSAPVRETFEYAFGSGGIGLVLPFRLVGSNQPRHTKVSGNRRNWKGSIITRRNYASLDSPTGLILKNVRKSPAKVTLESASGENTEQVVVYRSALSSPFKVEGQVPSLGPLYQYPQKGGVVQDTLRLIFPASKVHIEVPASAEWYGATLLAPDPGVVLHTLGHNGAFFSTYNKGGFMASMLQEFSPRLLIVSLGTNEALVKQFTPELITTEMRALYRQIQQVAPQCKVVFTSPLYSYKKKRVKRGVYKYISNSQCARVAEVIQAESQRLGCGFIDIFRIFGGTAGRELLTSYDILSTDHVHLTAQGYYAIGRVLSLALMRDYHHYLSRME